MGTDTKTDRCGLTSGGPRSAGDILRKIGDKVKNNLLFVLTLAAVFWGLILGEIKCYITLIFVPVNSDA